MRLFQNASAPRSFRRFSAARPIASTALAAVLFSSPLSASAFEADAFFKSLQEKAKENGDTLSFGMIDADGGDNVRLEAVELLDGESGNRLTIAEMELSGVEEAGEKGINFETMTASDIALDLRGKDGGDGKVTVASASAEDFRFVQSGPEILAGVSLPFAMANGRLDTIRLETRGKDDAQGSASLVLPYLEASGIEPESAGGFRIGSLASGAGTGGYQSEKGGTGSFELGAMKLENLARIGNSGLTLDSLSIGPLSVEGINGEGQTVSMTAEGFSAIQLFYPDFTSDAPLEFPETPSEANLGRINIALDGAEVMSLGGMAIQSTYDPSQKRNDASFTASDLSINVKAIPVEPGNEAGRKQLLDLGYETLTFDAEFSGGWDIDDGVLDIARYSIGMENGAAIAFSARLLGYSEAFARKFAQLSQLMNETNDTETQQALGMQMLAEASALLVDQLSIRVTDDSLTRKVLAMQAAKSGQSADDMAAAMPFMAGAMLSQFDVPEFAASVSSALGAFFSNPGNLVLSADPQEPVSVAEIMGIAAGAKAGNVTPAQIIERFNITMNANCSEKSGSQETVQC